MKLKKSTLKQNEYKQQFHTITNQVIVFFHKR